MAKSVQKNIAQSSFLQNEKYLGYIIAILAFLLYVRASGFDYALDDRAVTFQNKFVQKGFAGIPDILTTFYWNGFWESNSGLFRPLSLILFAAEWQFFPNSPHVYHFVNVLLYALASFFLFKALVRLFKNYGVALPFMATVIWVVLPVHVEVVANIKSADEILSVLFFALLLNSILRWNDEGDQKSLLLSLLFFFLALLSKEGAVLYLPVVLLALHFFRMKSLKELVKPAGYFIAATVVWLAWHQWVIAHASQERIAYTYHDNALVAAPDRLSAFATAIGMQGDYILKLIFGTSLSYDYSFNEYPALSLTSLSFLISLGVILALLFIAVKSVKTHPLISFGILFYACTFALTSNIFVLIGATMADRFLFVPSLGFGIVAAALLLKVLKENTLTTKTAMVLLPVLLIYSVNVYSRSSDWKDEATLFTADVLNAPGSARVHYNYGVMLLGNAQNTQDAGQKANLLDEAVKEFKIAYDIDSLDFQSCFNLGVAEFRRGNFKESVRWSHRAHALNPKDAVVYSNLGDAYTLAQQFDSAIYYLNKAIDGNAAFDDTWNMLGFSYLSKGDTAKALESFERGLAKDSMLVRTWDKLANVRGMCRMYQKSNEAFFHVIRLQPENPAPYKMIALNYMNLGDTASAMKYNQEYLKRGGK
ncbi:MAG: hypothetical protein Fur0041_19820 [Bacteroidia bacterium]